MNRTCEELAAQLGDYMDGLLSDADRESFEKGLLHCPELQDQVSQLKSLEGQLGHNEGLLVPSVADDAFYQMLEAEKAPSGRSNWWYAAAAVALLLVGGLAGAAISNMAQEDDHISALQQDVRYMKQLLVTAMLEEQSANDRIKAVSFAEDISQPDVDIIKVLVKSLNTDKSPNVRIAAANALGKWQVNELVRSELVKSMEYQKDPIVQITLINLLINMGEKSAIKPFRKIVEDEEVEQLVREQAQIGIEVLI